jgi:hypothetical protein
LGGEFAGGGALSPGSGEVCGGFSHQEFIMKTGRIFTTDDTDGETGLSYPCHPCDPWLKVFLFWIFPWLWQALAGTTAPAQVQQVWVAQYNNGIQNGANQAVKMVLDQAGSVYITGFSQDTNGHLDYATVKYSPSGLQLWATRYAGTNTNSAMPAGIAVDPSNNVIITGNAVTVKYDSNGEQLWTAPYDGTALVVDGAGNVYVTGFGTNFNTEKLAPNGSNDWQATFTDVGPTLSEVILLDSQTNL